MSVYQNLSNVGMVDLPLHKLHQALWRWCGWQHVSAYENICDMKQAWPGWDTNGGNIPEVSRLCFACELAQAVADFSHVPLCQACPIDTSGQRDGSGCCDGRYSAVRLAMEDGHQATFEWLCQSFVAAPWDIKC